MKKFLRLSGAVISLMFLFGILATASETRAQANPANEVLKRMEAHRQSLSSLRANVAMAKFNPQINETDVTEGMVQYMPAKGRDAYVRIDWTKPLQETFAVANGKYVLYQPRLKQAITGSTKNPKGNGKANNALAFMNMSREELKANYNYQYLGQANLSDGTPTWHLKLTPKTGGSYQSAEIWVDGNGMPLQMKVTESNNDATTVLLSNPQKNVPIDAKVFKVTLPPDTKIIKN